MVLSIFMSIILITFVTAFVLTFMPKTAELINNFIESSYTTLRIL